ncbi:MAG TPA: ATP-binding protein [Pseudolabrys sp.]|jgi:signal transduction histidine kinase/CheY-like chemotaxis protein|nr:ATP-binding protein [Pseudolabrys sp.]
MRARRDAALRLLKTMLVASVVFPAAFFAYASWLNFQNAFARADEQLTSSLNILSEQASKVFQSVDLTFAGVDAVLGELSDDQIKASAQAIHIQLSKLEKALKAVDGILVVDKSGHPLVSSAGFPIPEGADVADRDYFIAQADRDMGTYVGQILQPRIRKVPFFGVSRRRPAPSGQFAGVIMVAVVPQVFTDFYNELGRDSTASFSLARSDGAILARHPEPPGGVTHFGRNSGFVLNVTNNPEGGIVTSNNSVDGFQRRIAYRKLGYANLYVSDGLETRTIVNEWMRLMASHLIFGVPATTFLFILVLLTKRRTQAFYAEAERREIAEQALRQSQKMEAVGQLTGGVAHDFNNLLTIIIGNLGIAKRGVVEARAERALNNALVGAERAAQLTQRLLAFSRRQPLNPRVLDVNRLIVSISDLLARTLGENIELETIGGAGLWSVEVDSSELESTLLNLALNARDAMPEGGKLTIETSNAYLDDEYCRQHDGVIPGQYVLIGVTDSGAGMSTETIDRAFEPFFTTKEAGKGTGLGLSQVYGFMKQSEGHVKIYSEPGEGTTIKLYLPRRDGDEAAISAENSEGSDRGHGETILVVEDDDGVRQYAAEILRDLNYQVIEAKDSATALRLLDADKKFDLLLTDVVLPGKNGRELANEVEKRRPEVEIIFMTGYSRNAIVHHGRLDAGTELIPKPLIERVMARKIRQVLDSRSNG